MDTPIQMIVLFEPSRIPQRDGLGWLEHPDLSRFYAVPERDDENWLDVRKLREAGFTPLWVEFESEAPAELLALYETSPNAAIRDWHPTPPHEECLLACIWDTDCGPVAFYVRKVATA